MYIGVQLLDNYMEREAEMAKQEDPNAGFLLYLAAAGALGVFLWWLLIATGPKTPAPQPSLTRQAAVLPVECQVPGQIAPECLEGMTDSQRKSVTCGDRYDTKCVFVADGLLYFRA